MSWSSCRLSPQGASCRSWAVSRIEPAGERPGVAQRPQRLDRRGRAPLHVRRAAALEQAVLDRRRHERQVHGVEVAVELERPARAGRSRTGRPRPGRRDRRRRDVRPRSRRRSGSRPAGRGPRGPRRCGWALRPAHGRVDQPVAVDVRFQEIDESGCRFHGTHDIPTFACTPMVQRIFRDGSGWTRHYNPGDDRVPWASLDRVRTAAQAAERTLSRLPRIMGRIMTCVASISYRFHAAIVILWSAMAGYPSPGQSDDLRHQSTSRPRTPGYRPESGPELLTWRRAYMQRSTAGAREGRNPGGNSPRRSTPRSSISSTATPPPASFHTSVKSSWAKDKRFPNRGRPARPLSAVPARVRRPASPHLPQTARETAASANRGHGLGFTQFDLDQFALAVEETRLDLEAEQLQLRDRLDRMKAELGLAPGVALVPDPEGLEGFRRVFDEIGSWPLDRRRRLEDLSRLVGSLPAIGDVELDGLPLLTDHRPRAGPAGIPARGGGPDRGAEPRRCGEARRNGAHASNPPKAAGPEPQPPKLRRGDSPVHDPPEAERPASRATGGSSRSDPAGDTPELEGTRDARGRRPRMPEPPRRALDDLPGERLALYRDLGTLPCENWDEFYRLFSCKPGKVDPPPPPEQPAPAAPAPPAPRAPPAPPMPPR